MTAVHTAGQSARRAANNRVLVGLTRMGFIGYGILHLAVAWLALQITLGNGNQESDQAGAFRALAGQPFGVFILLVIVVGLCAMAIWQLLLAGIGHRDKRGAARAFERTASGARAVVYAVLAFTAGKVVAGAPSNSAQQQQQTTAGIMAKPAGVWLVGLAGLVVLAVGVGMLWYGYERKFEEKLIVGRMSANTRRLARRLGQVGYIAKGVAFAIVGFLLMDAAVTNDPGKSRGLDAALHTLVQQPFGTVLLIAVATGFAAFGVFCFAQARYRKVGS